MNRPKRIKELSAQIAELRRQQKALEKERDEVERGCGRKLAPDQWFAYCAGREMESLPSFCTECGGNLKLAEEPGS